MLHSEQTCSVFKTAGQRGAVDDHVNKPDPLTFSRNVNPSVLLGLCVKGLLDWYWALCGNVCAWLTAHVCVCVCVYKCHCVCECIYVSLMFTKGGSWRTSHGCGASQHSSRRRHRGPSPCSNSCAVSSHQVTRSDRVPRGGEAAVADLPARRFSWTVVCYVLRSSWRLWGVEH